MDLKQKVKKKNSSFRRIKETHMDVRLNHVSKLE